MPASLQDVPEFVTKGQLAQLHTSAMSRSRNAEKVPLAQPAYLGLMHPCLPGALYVSVTNNCVPHAGTQAELGHGGCAAPTGPPRGLHRPWSYAR